MANHDFLLVYDEAVHTWLRGEGCSVPPVRPGNRYPTKEEVTAAVEAQGLQAVVQGESIDVVPAPESPATVKKMTKLVEFWDCVDGRLVERGSPLARLVTIHSFHWDELNVEEKASITMRGNFPLELFIVRELTDRCGQLVVYPDTGDPPVIVEPGDDIGRKASIWVEQVKTDDSWAEFYRRVG